MKINSIDKLKIDKSRYNHYQKLTYGELQAKLNDISKAIEKYSDLDYFIKQDLSNDMYIINIIIIERRNVKFNLSK